MWYRTSLIIAGVAFVWLIIVCATGITVIRMYKTYSYRFAAVHGTVLNNATILDLSSRALAAYGIDLGDATPSSPSSGNSGSHKLISAQILWSSSKGQYLVRLRHEDEGYIVCEVTRLK